MSARLSHLPPPPGRSPPGYESHDEGGVPDAEKRRSRPSHIELPIGNGVRMSDAPRSPVRFGNAGQTIATPSSAQFETASPPLSTHSNNPAFELPDMGNHPSQPNRPPPPPQHRVRLVPGNGNNFSRPRSAQSAQSGLVAPHASGPNSPQIIATDETGARNNVSEVGASANAEPESEPLQYFHTRDLSSASANRKSEYQSSPDARPRSAGNLLSRPMSAIMLDSSGRSPSPGVSPDRRPNSIYARGRSPNNRPMSYIDLLNAPYPQPAPSASNINQNEVLRPSVGLNASLLSSKTTFEMYLANVKKTPDLQVQYTFATFLVQTVQDLRQGVGAASTASGASNETPLSKPETLITEARKILENLAGKSYPFAQYFLADGYTSGLFTKDGEPDDDRALPLFVAASKHGHAESGYRAGLCYEKGWGTRRDGGKAAQYFRASASKGHPGAMARLAEACLTGSLGMPINKREGVRWYRRAAEKADQQYNHAPYELGLLHVTGFGDDVFKDESYTAQMFTQSAMLGHAEAAYRMGRAYEHAELKCPTDPALSLHFYNIAANAGHPEAMLSLAAWYLVGSEILPKDEIEAFEWAQRSAALKYPKGLFTAGYFHETGVGCRADSLAAQVCYREAAELGYQRGRDRLNAIYAAASGGSSLSEEKTAAAKDSKSAKGKTKGKGKEREAEMGRDSDGEGKEKDRDSPKGRGKDGEKRKKKLGLF